MVLNLLLCGFQGICDSKRRQSTLLIHINESRNSRKSDRWLIYDAEVAVANKFLASAHILSVVSSDLYRKGENITNVDVTVLNLS